MRNKYERIRVLAERTDKRASSPEEPWTPTVLLKPNIVEYIHCTVKAADTEVKGAL
jgi:hypothetical protein